MKSGLSELSSGSPQALISLRLFSSPPRALSSGPPKESPRKSFAKPSYLSCTAENAVDALEEIFPHIERNPPLENKSPPPPPRGLGLADRPIVEGELGDLDPNAGEGLSESLKLSCLFRCVSFLRACVLDKGLRSDTEYAGDGGPCKPGGGDRAGEGAMRMELSVVNSAGSCSALSIDGTYSGS